VHREPKSRRRQSSWGHGPPLKNIASVSFGGADLKTVYLGNLAGDRIATFRSPIARRRTGAAALFSQSSIASLGTPATPAEARPRAPKHAGGTDL